MLHSPAFTTTLTLTVHSHILILISETRDSSSISYRLHILPSISMLYATTTPEPPPPSFAIPPTRSVISTAVSHTLLHHGGSVSTFGSALHSSLLARQPTASTPASEPHPVPFFGGLDIRALKSSEWLCAALSYDRDLYVWGSGVPGAGIVSTEVEDRIACLPQRGADEGEMVKLVDIEGKDIADFGVGDGHLVVLTRDEKPEVWVCGRNVEGQLGIGGGGKFEAEWVRVDDSVWGGDTVLGVYAGGWGTLAVSHKDTSVEG